MEKQNVYQLKIYDDLGDLLLNAEALARVLAGTASKSDYHNIEWRTAECCKKLSALLHLMGGVLPTLDFENVESLNVHHDIQDVKDGYRVLMQMAAGLLEALFSIQAACLKHSAHLTAPTVSPVSPQS